MKSKTIIVIVIYTLALSQMVSNQQLQPPSASSSDRLSTISVSGFASSYLNPELVLINLRIKTESKDPMKAVQENSKIAAKVQESLNSVGISVDNLSTSGYSISPVYETVYINNNYKQEMKGYEVINFITVKSEKLDLAGKVLDTAVNSGVQEITGLSFELKPETKIKAEDELLKSAMENAKYKAELALKPLGYKVIGVHSVNLNQFNYQQPVYYERAMYDVASSGGSSVYQSTKEISTSVNVVFLTEKI